MPQFVIFPLDLKQSIEQEVQILLPGCVILMAKTNQEALDKLYTLNSIYSEFNWSCFPILENSKQGVFISHNLKFSD